MREHAFFRAVDIYIMDASFVNQTWDIFSRYNLLMRLALVIYVRFCWIAGSCQEDEPW